MTERGVRARAPQRVGLGKTLAIMVGLGIALLWAFVFLIPYVKDEGIPPRYADKLPFLGFVIGAAWGYGITVSKSVSAAFRYLTTPLIVGAGMWFVGVLAGGVCVALGIEPEEADYIPPYAFALGAALGLVPLIIRLLEVVNILRPRRRRRAQG